MSDGLPYSSSQFVNRDKEIQLVIEAARGITQQKSCPDRRKTIVFHGERGIGKSWLLQELQSRLKDKCPGCLISLIDIATYRKGNSGLAVCQILQKLARTTLKRSSFPSTPSEANREWRQLVERKLADQSFILLLDTVFEADRTLLYSLEDYVLGPLLQAPYIMIVMAGRGRAPIWKSPELRLYAQPYRLEPFKQAYTDEQLARLKQQSRPEIYEISGGNPLLNYLLAERRATPSGLDEVIWEMLDTIPTKEDRQSVREYLEALSVLKVIHEDCIPVMLDAYYDSVAYIQDPYAQAREVRERLLGWGLAEWEAEWGGYKLDRSTRRLINLFLEQANPDKYRQLHQAAYDLYTKWAQQYPEAEARWQPLIEYHQEEMKER